MDRLRYVGSPTIGFCPWSRNASRSTGHVLQPRNYERWQGGTTLACDGINTTHTAWPTSPRPEHTADRLDRERGYYPQEIEGNEESTPTATPGRAWYRRAQRATSPAISVTPRKRPNAEPITPRKQRPRDRVSRHGHGTPVTSGTASAAARVVLRSGVGVGARSWDWQW